MKDINTVLLKIALIKPTIVCDLPVPGGPKMREIFGMI